MYYFILLQMPYLNPARALGPSFVLDRWENHWVSWMGTLAGGAVSGILYEIIFSTKRSKLSKEMDDSSSSMNSEEDNINYDLEMDKPDPAQAKYHGSTYNGYRNVPGNAQGYCQTVYATGSTKVDRVESIYGGTRSLYCKSPPLTRANLHQLARSQSVYAKSQTAINRDTGSVRAGPLVPAQSLYPLQVSSRQQNTHLQNQNVQNQLQQVNSRSESIYGIRSSMRQQQPTSDRMSDRVLSQDPQVFQPIYGSRTNQPPPVDNMKFERDPRDLREARESRDGPSKYRNRPDSVYGARRPGQSAQSDDSSYGSYHGSTLTPPANGVGNYQHNQPPQMQQIIQQQQSNYGILPPPAQQIERKISSSTVQQQQQRPVEFVAQKPNASLQQQQPQNYAMHPIRQN